ncbi:MAG: 2-polyprenyl-3-methyl-6-methoxy-1,4-benzoquinone monooxygenase [Gammaproteobacteria bacterium]|nr:2-polyprenyl-3-methyl-6-methoxy-1,4-benzoquinone monooxygenase [Gammaproteobacteria bacterium]
MALIDDVVLQVDNALRTLSGSRTALRDNPASDVAEASLSEDEQVHAAGLMRVNHTGEICAQALYEGQALTAKDADTRSSLLSAAQEEVDHLAWCEERLVELGSKPSVLNPIFYAASYAMGAVTGLLGDKVSLGFVEATEDQVCQHLDSHLESLPKDDARSRAIVSRMHEDEARHGTEAISAGGMEFPRPVKNLMTLISKVMTETSYKI